MCEKRSERDRRSGSERKSVITVMVERSGVEWSGGGGGEGGSVCAT